MGLDVIVGNELWEIEIDNSEVRQHISVLVGKWDMKVACAQTRSNDKAKLGRDRCMLTYTECMLQEEGEAYSNASHYN